MANEPIRVLHVVTQMTRGGLETMLMNYDRCIDHSKVQFDFLEHRSAVTDYDREILDMGGKIYRLPRLNPASPSYLKALDHFFSEHPEYRIVHSHLNSMAGIPLKAAKKYEVPVRIAHAHSSNQEKNFKYPIKQFYKKSIPQYATDLFACGEAAGKWMYGGYPFTVVNNAIDAKQFVFDKKVRSQAREELGIHSTTLVLGHVGRFSPPKNHTFLVDIFRAVLSLHPDSKLLLVGQGNLEQEVRNKCNDYGILDHVVFAGVRNDVYRLMQAMDVFVFPSLYEGLGIVAVEAQAAGLPCVVSDRVPKECEKTNGLVSYLPLDQNPDDWAKRIIEAAATERKDTSAEIMNNGFDISENARWLQDFYLSQWR